MATKLGKNCYPAKCNAEDLKCYGPPAINDTEFDGCKIVDMGCFSQEGVDSNKYFHVAMCTDLQMNWYVYTEYGRQGAKNPQFQFISCASETEAEKEFKKKCAEKNTKRGQWDTVSGLKMFVPKNGKDMYSVRKLAKRSHGLPDAQAITTTDSVPLKTKKNKSSKLRCDTQTTSLMRDLLGGTVQYTRSSLQGGTIPVQTALDEARDMLSCAKKRLVNVGDDLNDQVSDKDLRQITYSLYSRIPKIKPLNSTESSWILSKDNIFGWEQDLDAFESALLSGDIDEIANDDPMESMPVDMEWVDPQSDIGKWLHNWWPNASKNKHSHVGQMKIKNLWKIDRHGDNDVFREKIESIEKHVKNISERPLHQDKKRLDLNTADRKKYWNNNVSMLFHGTRSVNVSGILRSNLKLPAQLSGVVITGNMFGSGIYWADDWRKSAGYTSLKNSYWSRGSGEVKNRSAFMFLADVALGEAHVAPRSHGYTSPPKGYDCVFGKMGVSGVQNNEWIVYESGRSVLKYLVEFDA